MSDIYTFLMARNDEDLAQAEGWSRAYNVPGVNPGYHYATLRRHREEWPMLWHYLDHFSPTRMLAEAEARRQLIERERPVFSDENKSDHELHELRRHPDFEYATTEGPRKAWDDQNEPPDGEGWERNTAAGIDGWERFNYTEESYWRRRVSTGRAVAAPVPMVLRILAARDATHPDYDPAWAL